MTCPSENVLAAEKAEKNLEKESATEDAKEGERSADGTEHKISKKKEEDEEEGGDKETEVESGTGEAAALDNGEVDGERIFKRAIVCACTGVYFVRVLLGFDLAVEGRVLRYLVGMHAIEPLVCACVRV